MNNDAPVTEKEKQEQIQLPGALLLAAREKAGLSIREVAEQLHLLPNQVEALETDNFSFFNGPIFCKGYLKSYARLLELDAEEVVGLFSASLPGQEQAEIKKPAAVAQPIQRPSKGYSLQYWLAGFVLVLMVFLWAAYQGDSSVETVESTALASTEIDENNNEFVQELKPKVDKIAVSESSTQEQDIAQIPQRPDQLAEGIISQPLPDVTGEQAVLDSILTDTIGSLLHFSFTEDCWVEIKDSSDKVIFADLKRADDKLELSGLAPFEVLLGYAPGVSLDYNGESFDIPIRSGRNSSRFVVGEE